MESSDKEALIRNFIEMVWNQASDTALEELTTPGYLYRLGGQPPRDRKAMREFLRAVRAAFPDWRVEIRDLINEGDRVAVRWEGTVTYLGPFQGLAPTGKKVQVSGINIYHFEGNRVSAEFEQMDSAGLLRQLEVGFMK